MCMHVSMYVYVHICLHYYRLVIKYQQLILLASNYIDLWVHSHQENKQTSKKKYSLLWEVEPDQFYWGEPEQ